MNKKLLYFILFDLFIALFLIFDFGFKHHQPMVTTENSSENINTISNQKQQIISNGYPVSSVSNPVTVKNDNTSTHTGACVAYGPLNLEQKVSIDLILSKNQINSQLYTEKKSALYSVDWNLGKDKIQAINLFEKQKNDGALQDEKFKIIQNSNGEWIVPITVIAENPQLAQKMVTDLSHSSQSFGGKWEYKPRPDGYFYYFKDITLLPNSTLETINKTIDVIKTPC